MAIKHVAFDVWGTIFKSNPTYANARAEVIQLVFLPNTSIEAIHAVFESCKKLFDTHEYASGESIPYDYKQMTLVRELNLPLETSTDPRWQALFTELFLNNPPELYSPIIPDLINGWSAVGTTSIISNTHFIRGKIMRRVLQASGIDMPQIEWCLFSDEGRWCKPHAEMFNQITELVGASHQITPEECLMVGNDRILDIIPAEELGWRTHHIVNANSWLEFYRRTA